MSWLRSRRFYAGLLAGLVPFLLLSAQSSGTRTGQEEARRVVVRTYAGCCPDSTDAARTRALVESLPPDVVLVETFAGCCCGDTTRVYGPTSARSVFVPPAPITGTGPAHERPATSYTPPDLDYPAAVHPGGSPGIVALPLEDYDTGLPSVVYAPTAQAAESRTPILPFLGFLVPIFGALLDGSTDGTICPDDSGLPIGPNRPRC